MTKVKMNEKIENAIEEKTNQVEIRQLEIKQLANSEKKFDCVRIAELCQQVNILLNQVETLQNLYCPF